MLHYSDDSLTVHIGDCRAVMAEMPAESVHCVVTSPPYWGLRDYGTATWEGGGWTCGGRHEPIKADADWWGKSSDEISAEIESETVPPDVLSGDACPTCRAPRCDHTAVRRPGPDDKSFTNGGTSRDKPTNLCRKCGARRIDAQLGLEPTPEEYVVAMVDVFRQVRRVLRDDGTVWLNLGDSYANDTKWGGQTSRKHARSLHGKTPLIRAQKTTGLKAKDLVGIPWRVAFALQADGWYLRSDIIWAKPNPMPESVTDRPTKAHEYVFLLSKAPRYYFDADAVREASTSPEQDAHNQRYAKPYAVYDDRAGDTGQPGNVNNVGIHARPGPGGRNLRSVWTIATQPYPGAHFATFPEKLVEPCVKAGTSERGVCPECGAPWVRETERTDEERADFKGSTFDGGKTGARDGGDRTQPGPRLVKRAIGWRPSCECGAPHFDKFTVPATVLDPFAGSGTVGRVANRLGRRAVLIDLSADYIDQAMVRNAQAGLGLSA